MKAKFTVSLYLDTRTTKADSTFPVKIRVYCNGVRKYYGIPASEMNNRLLKNHLLSEFQVKDANYSLSEEVWQKATKANPGGKYRDLNKAFQSLEADLIDTINQLPEINHDTIANKIFPKQTRTAVDDVFQAWDKLITELNTAARTKYAIMNQCALSSLQKFHKKPVLKFNQITPDFLERFEAYHTEQGHSLNTVGMYMRSIRKLMYLPENKKFVTVNPFIDNDDSEGYAIPASTGRKVALFKEELTQLKEYQPKNEVESEFTKLWFVFMDCNGANPADVLRFKHENISGNTLYFKRKKTARTKKEAVEIKVNLTSRAKEFFETYGTKPGDAKYILPYLNGCTSPMEETKKIELVVKQVNKYIKRAAVAVGIDKKVSVQVSRHSFGTLMRDVAKLPAEQIQKLYEHSSIKVTSNYLQSLPKNVNDEVATALESI